MNKQRAESILEGQTNVARKVFAAVPMQEFWSVGQISNEMVRVEKHNLSKGEITGCLRSLVDAGLVAEAGMLTFRSNVKAELTLKEVPVSAPPAKKQPKPSLMDRMFALATSLRDVAEQVETLAMEVDTAILDASKGDEKLKQIQATMRSLMGEEA